MKVTRHLSAITINKQDIMTGRLGYIPWMSSTKIQSPVPHVFSVSRHGSRTSATTDTMVTHIVPPSSTQATFSDPSIEQPA